MDADMKSFDFDGHISKEATLAGFDVTDDDLAKINEYAIKPLTADDVFVFKAYLCDNEPANDRNCSPFTSKAIADMAELYKGVTVIFDHSRSAKNQVARVFDTALEIDESKKTTSGEPLTALYAKCYMLRDNPVCQSVEAGILKELSVDVIPTSYTCSICGADRCQGDWCDHRAGAKYFVQKGVATSKETCRFVIDGVSDIYELSFVAVGSQRNAQVTKSADEADDQTATDIEALRIRISIAEAEGLTASQ